MRPVYPAIDGRPFLRRGARGGEEDDPEAVAFLELDEPQARAFGKQFVDGSRLQTGVHNLPDDNVVVYGYPLEQSTARC